MHRMLICKIDKGVHFRYTKKMNTKIIGIKDFRKNISGYAQKAQKGEAKYIIMNRNKPLFEIKPFCKSEGLEALFADISSAQEDIKKGNIHTQEDIFAEFF